MSATDGAPLNDQCLADVAQELGGPVASFRLGLYLGLLPHQIDSILEDDPSQTLWQRNMKILTMWREKGGPPDHDERFVLCKALKRLGLGRLASTVDHRAGSIHLNSFINPGNPNFKPCELEEIAREVGGEWEQLGVWLGLSEHKKTEISCRREDVSLQAFRCLWAWYEAGESVTRERLADSLRKIGKGRLASQITN